MISWQMADTINVPQEVRYSLRTFSLLKGQPIFEARTGSKIGEVIDLYIIDGMVKGLMVTKGAFFKQNYYLDIHNVTSFGWDGVMIEDDDQLDKLKATPEYTLTHQHSLSGKMLLSRSGETLGLLEDVYFQEEVGTIVGYEITDGFFSDITEGKQVIHSQTPPAIGKDAIIVDVNQYVRCPFMFKCPNCQSKDIGKIGINQYYCWSCFIELSLDKGIINTHQVEEDGTLSSLDDLFEEEERRYTL